MPDIISTRRKAFPDRVAFDNPCANYFEVDFKEEISVSKRLRLKGLPLSSPSENKGVLEWRPEDALEPVPFHLLDLKPELDLNEAALFFRPYILLLKGMFDAKFNFRFSLGLGVATPEDETIIKDVPAGYFTVSGMDDPRLDLPLEQLQWSWPTSPNPGISCALKARPCHTPLNEDEADKWRTVLGLFGTNGNSVTGWLTDVVCSRDCEIEAGILAAVYTTKIS